MSTLNEQIPLPLPFPDNHEIQFDEAGNIEWHDRMRIIADEFGFLPTTREELSRAFVIIPFLVHSGKTAAHLNEVLRHNKFHGATEPAAAVRSLVSAMGVYAGDAKEHTTRLEDFIVTLDDINPHLTVGLTDITTNRALLDVLQYQDLRIGVQTSDPTSLEGSVVKTGAGRKLRTHYGIDEHDDLLTHQKTEHLHGLTVLDIKIDARHAANSHVNRAEFWHQRIEESRKHGAAKQVASRILDLA